VAGFEIRAGRLEEARALVELFAAVAEERDGIASEPPIDLDARTTDFALGMDHTLVAVAGDELVGLVHLEPSRHGFAEVAMLVAREWRGRGVGSALLAAAIGRARADGYHKLSLEVFPHNEAGVALYRKFGFVEEGRKVQQYRRSSGELWDSVVMGLLL
jgi:ribosomal protein S18 acetylase RimI-like enzyme